MSFLVKFLVIFFTLFCGIIFGMQISRQESSAKIEDPIIKNISSPPQIPTPIIELPDESLEQNSEITKKSALSVIGKKLDNVISSFFENAIKPLN